MMRRSQRECVRTIDQREVQFPAAPFVLTRRLLPGSLEDGGRSAPTRERSCSRRAERRPGFPGSDRCNTFLATRGWRETSESCRDVRMSSLAVTPNIRLPDLSSFFSFNHQISWLPFRSANFFYHHLLPSPIPHRALLHIASVCSYDLTSHNLLI